MFLLGERVARYDPMLAEHDHFVCQRCGRIEDILFDRDRRVNLAPLVDRGFTVTAHSLAIHGLCQPCGRERRGDFRKRPAQRVSGGRGRRRTASPGKEEQYGI
jgi:hypothetical protein